MTVFRRVVFPAPFGPRSAVTLWGSMVREIDLRMCRSLNFCSSFLMLNTGATPFGG